MYVVDRHVAEHCSQPHNLMDAPSWMHSYLTTALNGRCDRWNLVSKPTKEAVLMGGWSAKAEPVDG